MKQEDKDLLLRDLCARIPYGVKVQAYSYEHDVETIETLYAIDSDGYMSTLECDTLDHISKPYLFPLSSMTEEQINDCPIGETNLNIIKSNTGYGIIEIPWRLLYLFIDWCYKNHFDVYGLIPKGLAINATGLNIY